MGRIMRLYPLVPGKNNSFKRLTDIKSSKKKTISISTKSNDKTEKLEFILKYLKRQKSVKIIRMLADKVKKSPTISKTIYDLFSSKKSAVTMKRKSNAARKLGS
jgi:hypothetical protein